MDIFEEDLYTVTVVGDVRDPYPEFAEMRRRAPVVQEQVFDNVVFKAFKYHDIDRVLREAETFSSRLFGPVMGVVMGPSILQMDGGEHRSHRSIIGGAFRRQALTDWESSFIEPTVQTLIDRFASRGDAELVRELTFHYPIQVIAKILGVPVEDYRTFARLSPPLRTEQDRLAVREALADGTIDTIGSGHDPRGPEDKRLPYADAAPGMAGAETLLPLTMSLVRDGVIDIARAFELLGSPVPVRLT